MRYAQQMKENLEHLRKVNISKEIGRFVFIQKDDDGLNTDTEKRYSKHLKQWIPLVRLQQEGKSKVYRVLPFSTDVQIDPLKLIQYYKALFQIKARVNPYDKMVSLSFFILYTQDM